MENFPNWVDHIVAFLFCIVFPLIAIKQYKKNITPITYTSQQKRSFYLSTCLSQLIMVTIILAVWLLFRRPLAEIGLTLNIKENLWIWPLIIFIVLYTLEIINTVVTTKNIASYTSEWEKRTPFLPINMKEFRDYLLLCLCAGVIEEIIYRGYMLTYFDYLFKDSANGQSISVILPAIIFSVSHFYHGLKNIIKIFVLSILFGYIYVFSGSLVIVMIVHFLVDVIGGWLSVKYIKNTNH